MTKPLRNIPASIRVRLRQRATDLGEDFQLVLQRYAVERLLYRISISPYRTLFTLKGAMLLLVWGDDVYRPTRDLDLLGTGAADSARITASFKQLCAIAVPEDGITFDPASVTAEPIAKDGEVLGARVKLVAHLEQARFRIQVDVGYGDVVVPAPVELDYPTLLGGPVPHVLAYTRDTVIAEKLHALVYFGVVTSRYKDFYDMFMLSQRFPFDGATLAGAVKATFAKRKPPLPTALPPALAPTFFEAPERAAQWRAFLNRSRLTTAPNDFAAVGEWLRGFLGPLIEAVAAEGTFSGKWSPGGPWKA